MKRIIPTLLLSAITGGVTTSIAQTPLPAVEKISLPGRQIQQLIDATEEFDRDLSIREMREKRVEEQKEQQAASSKVSDGIRFFLSEIQTTPTDILTKEEISEAVAPYLDKEVTGQDLNQMIAAINKQYLKKGYAVCQAFILPQRIQNGVLFVTLIEGKTGKVQVKKITPEGSSDKLNTRESYITRGFGLEPGQVANYRDIYGKLIRFNMTNDIQVGLDMSAGDKVGETDYTFLVKEPDARSFELFVDSYGNRSSGRLRAGVGYTERSVFGWRDRFQFAGLVSEGSRSMLASYTVPLNSFGTRLSVSGSYGYVKVTDGPSEELDIKGHSTYLSARLEHPFYVSSNAKFTGYTQGAVQHSVTDMFGDFRINNVRTKSLTLGGEQIYLTDTGTYYGNLSIGEYWSQDVVFSLDDKFTKLNGTFMWYQNLPKNFGVDAGLNFQKRLGGVPIASGEFFYLGTNTGIRGYDNDLIAAESGVSASVTFRYDFDQRGSKVFLFADAGRIAGVSSYTKKCLSSLGGGFKWQPTEMIGIEGTVAFPLVHSVDGQHVNKARFDFRASLVW